MQEVSHDFKHHRTLLYGAFFLALGFHKAGDCLFIFSFFLVQIYIGKSKRNKNKFCRVSFRGYVYLAKS